MTRAATCDIHPSRTTGISYRITGRSSDFNPQGAASPY